MNRSLILAALVGVALLALGPARAQAQYYYHTYSYPAPTYGIPAPSYFAPPSTSYYGVPNTGGMPFVGNSYSFYSPSYSSSYYLPSFSSYATQSLGYQTTPYRTPTLYLQPGPYYYTPAQSYTPEYYGYYYSPRFFRY